MDGIGDAPVEPDVPRRLVFASGCGQRTLVALDAPEEQRQVRPSLDGQVPRVLAPDRPGHVRQLPDAELFLKLGTKTGRSIRSSKTKNAEHREGSDEATQQQGHCGCGGWGI